jgi:uracil-DNA glycosylase
LKSAGFVELPIFAALREAPRFLTSAVAHWFSSLHITGSLMDDIRKAFLEIIADVRAHVEFQRALGVKAIAVAPPEPETASRGAEAAPAVQPAPAEGLPASRLDSPAPAPSGGPGSLEDIRLDIGDCTRCKLHKGRNSIVFGEGNPKAAVIFVGEGPGYEEDQQGRPFVGAAGQLLTDIIEKGMKIQRQDVYICNIVKCRPPENRNPEPDEVNACIGFVKRQIAAVNPRVIVTLGNVPTQNLLGTKAGITKIRGTWQEYEGIPVMPTFHPSYLLRSPGEKGKVWQDIKKVMERIGLLVSPKETGDRRQETGEESTSS